MKKFLFPMLSALVLAAISAVPVFAAQTRVSNVETYSHSDGVNYFEFGLQAPQIASQFGNEVVFLFDTSASQVGPVRKEQFVALKSALKHLPAATKVQLFSVDVDTQACTTKFVDAQGKEFAAAIAKLESNNVPLGSSDLLKALDVVLSTFAKQGTPNAKRTVLYIGDGRSSGKVMLPAKFDEFAKKLVSAKISFSACPMGVASNFGIVGALANRTGGLIVSVAGVDPNHVGYEIGEALALSVKATVFWPDAKTLTIPADWEIYPATLPPLRSDRETILLGKTSAKTVAPKLSVTLRTFDGKVGQLVWDLKVGASNTENQYLVNFVELASTDNDATMPIAGREILETMKDLLIEQQSAELAVAEEALKSGQNEAAAQIARQISKRTNNSNEAAKEILDRAEGNVTNIAERLGEISTALPTLQFDDELEEVSPFDDEEEEVDSFDFGSGNVTLDVGEESSGFNFGDEEEIEAETGKNNLETITAPPTVTVPARQATPIPAPTLPNSTPAIAPPAATQNGNILDRAEQMDNTIDTFQKSNTVRVQSMSSAVNKSLADAEKLMQTNPESALLGLKMMKAELVNDASLPPNDRLRLIDALETKMKSAYHNKQKAELLQIQRDAVVATKKHHELLVGQAHRSGEKVKQIFQRFDALINEGMYAEADVAAQAATDLLPPTRSAGVTASLYAHTMGSVMEIEALRAARQRGVIEVLMNIERVFVPLSDEPPLIYPDPEIWRRLSEKRTADWSAVDLSSSGEMEKKIIKALDSVAEIDAEEMSLQELADDLRQKYGFIVVFDTAAIDEGDSSASPESQFSGTYTGISLRSALKNILGNFSLTYCIKNECLTITTPEAVQKSMTIKVYPVGDLVVRPTPLQGSPMGGGMGGGGMGGGMSMGGMGGMGGMM